MKSGNLRWLGVFVLDTILAVYGTAISEGPFYRAIPAHTISIILWKSWYLDIAFATLIGFLMYRTWKSNSTRWVWVLPALWFGLGVLVRGSRPLPSALYEDSPFEYFWTQFSGIDCKNGTKSLGCMKFFLFSVPLVRGISYSIGGLVSSRICNQPLAPWRLAASPSGSGELGGPGSA